MSEQESTAKRSASTLRLAKLPPAELAASIANAAIRPSINAAIVTHTFQGNHLGNEVDLSCLVDALTERMEANNKGDLFHLEAMLYAQASALQTMFSSLARRARSQDSLKQYSTHMGFALKAQAQSRATIQTLIELKMPRPVAFVKQANIAHGHQQTNNGVPPAQTLSHATDIDANFQNELLEAPDGKLCKRLDNGATQQAKRGNSKVAAVEKRHRTAKPRR